MSDQMTPDQATKKAASLSRDLRNEARARTAMRKLSNIRELHLFGSNQSVYASFRQMMDVIERWENRDESPD